MVELREEDIIPYFQPIIAADKGGIFGYEVLGRVIEDGKIKSLGYLFEDEDVSEDDKLIVDRIVRRKAFETYKKSSCDSQLFINMRTKWVYDCAVDNRESKTLKYLEKYDIDPKKIVIEITEESFEGDMESLNPIISRYRKSGCLLAIDDFGRGSSNFERIAYIRPDIVKIDQMIVHKMEHDLSFRDMCRALNFFADTLGIDVLFEGVENVDQLNQCMKAKGQFFQGYLFARPGPSPEGKECRSDLIDKERDHINEEEHNVERCLKMATLKIDKCVLRDMDDLFFKNSEDVLGKDLTPFLMNLPKYCKVVYICDKKGNQLSYNYRLDPEGVTIIKEVAHKNWLHRTHFRNALLQLAVKERSIVTESYRDITTREYVRTYISQINDEHILFIDMDENELESRV